MMVSEPLDRDPADRLDRYLDALVRGEPARPPDDPALRPVLRLFHRVAQRRPALSTAARQRIWQRIETAPLAEILPGGEERERSPIMATMPRPFGERSEQPARRSRRWRPALELTVGALLLLALIGGVLVQRPPQTPTVPGIVTSPEATSGPTNYRYGLNLLIHVVPQSGQSISPALVDAERAVITKRIEALGFQYKISQGPDTLAVDIMDVNLPVEFVEAVLTETGLFEIIETHGKELVPGTAVQTRLNGAPGAATPGAATPGVATPGAVYTTIVSSADVADAFPTAGPTGGQVVGFTLNADGAAKMHQYTRAHIGQPLAIVLDKRVLDSVTIQGTIADSGIVESVSPPVEGMISTATTPTTGPPLPAQNALVAYLKSGPLPVPAKVSSTRFSPATPALR